MRIVSTEASKEVHRLAREMTKYWPQMQEEFMSALSDWELDMRKACEEAEKVIENLKALAIVRGDATVEFIKGKSNHYVVYNTTYKCLDVSDNCYLIKNGIFGLPYFSTEDDARRSIEQHKDEWLTIFGVKE